MRGQTATSSSPLAAALSRLRPAERVLLAYVLVALFRMLTLKSFDLHVKEFARDDLVAAAALVGTIKLAVENRRRSWPSKKDGEDAAPPPIRFLRLLLFVFVAPFVLVLVSRPDLFPRAKDEGGSMIPIVLTAHSWLRTGLLALLPPVMVWLALALHLKTRGALSLRHLAVDSAIALARETREWLPPLAMLYAYTLFGTVVQHPWFADQDLLLARVDRAMFFGHDPVLSVEALIWSPLSEWLSACYTFYLFLFPLVLGAAYAHEKRHAFRETAFITCFALAVGYVGYTIVPARGPLFVTTFTRSLDLYYVGWLKDQLMDKTRVPRDCFPSLHTCMSCVLIWCTWHHARKMFWVLLPIVVFIPFACVYLRYHYVIDVLAGLALFWAATRITLRLRKRGAFAVDPT